MTGPVELRSVGKDWEGNPLWDAYDTKIRDWVGVVPPFPTTKKARVETCVRRMNEEYSKTASAA